MGGIIMKHRLLVVVFSLAISTALFAQASGGQIKRRTPKPKTEVRKVSKPRRSTTQTVQTEQSTPTYTPPAVQTVPLSNLAKYNLVIGSFSIGANAQQLCTVMKERGYNSFLYLEITSPPMYRVIVASSNAESDILSAANKLKNQFPGLWILYVENGQIYRMQISL